MIEDFLTWVELLSLTVQQSQVLTSQNQSNVIFIAYIVTIRKSYLFGAAFLLSEVAGVTEIVPASLSVEMYGLAFFCVYLTSWCAISYFHITRTDNKITLICCAIMIGFLLLMAWDSYLNAYNQTFIWAHYETIILCIHVSIIVSLYSNRFITDSLVGEPVNLCSIWRFDATS